MKKIAINLLLIVLIALAISIAIKLTQLNDYSTEYYEDELTTIWVMAGVENKYHTTSSDDTY